MSEIPQLAPEIASFPSREIFPDEAYIQDAFRKGVAGGTIELTRTENGGADATIYYDRVHFENVNLLSVDEIQKKYGHEAPSLDAFEADTDDVTRHQVRGIRDSLIEEKCFQGSWRRNAWWLSSLRRNSDYVKEGNLFGAAQVTIGHNNIAIHNFDKDTDFDDFLDNLPGVLSVYTGRGINIADFCNVINIVPQNAKDVTVGLPPNAPEDVYCHAAMGRDGVMIVNARGLKDGVDGSRGEHNNRMYSSGEGWGGTITHELAHSVDFVTNQAEKGLGWRNRHNFTTDDQGNLMPVDRSDSFFGERRIQDDFGNEVVLQECQGPFVLDAAKREYGETFPVTPYAATLPDEDVAESITAFLGGPGVREGALALDSLRTEVVKKLLAQYEGDTPLQIEVHKFELNEYDPVQVLPKKVAYSEMFTDSIRLLSHN